MLLRRIQTMVFGFSLVFKYLIIKFNEENTFEVKFHMLFIKYC